MAVVIIDEDLIDSAFAQAGQIGKAGGLTVRGLNAPLDGKEATWTEQLWDTAHGAVRAAWEKGKDAAKDLLDKFHQELEEFDQKIGEAAAMVRKVIGQHLNQLFTLVVGGALER